MLRQHINEAITHECARITCSFCGYTRLDPGFATAVATKLPKLQNTQRYSLREILRALYSVGPYAAFDGERDVLCPDHTYKAVYGKKYYEQAADLLNKNVPGLCYFCMAEGRNEADCEHEMELKQRISRLDTIASQFNANRK